MFSLVGMIACGSLATETKLCERFEPTAVLVAIPGHFLLRLQENGSNLRSKLNTLTTTVCPRRWPRLTISFRGCISNASSLEDTSSFISGIGIVKPCLATFEKFCWIIGHCLGRISTAEA